MNIAEMNAKIKEVYKRHADTIDNDYSGEYEFIGIRFEDKDRNVNEIVYDLSRNNADREDERDFPEYGTEEYEEMEELDGVSAWQFEQYDFNIPSYLSEEDDCKRIAYTEHCYVLGTNDLGQADIMDDGEIIMIEPTVLAKIF